MTGKDVRRPKRHFLYAFDVANEQMLTNIVGEALHGAEDGELYAESTQTEQVHFKDGKVDGSIYGDAEGFGIRKVVGYESGYVYSSDLSREALQRVVLDVSGLVNKTGSYASVSKRKRVSKKYPSISPLSVSLPERIVLLQRIDTYVRNSDPRVREVEISLSGGVERVLIARPDGFVCADVRPLTRLNIFVTLADEKRTVSGRAGFGGRHDYALLFDTAAWQYAADQAMEEARLLLCAEDCPSGVMPVVLGPGWSAVLLHEAIGHTLEGDFNRLKVSPFADKMGMMVAHPDVTVVDDGTISGRRGSLTIDDEGTPTQRTVLVDAGRVASFIHDRMSARHFGVLPTGNGRRESFRFQPMPRMTNTYMLPGPYDPREIIKVTEQGLYIERFGGGQVMIATGNFVFQAEVVFPIEGGVVRFDRPMRQATLTGTGYDVLTHVDMVGNDMALDPGVGTCGKNGQSVPVGVGQPTIRLAEGAVVVGGSAT